MMRIVPTRAIFFLPLLLTVLLVAACGSGSDPADSSGTASGAHDGADQASSDAPDGAPASLSGTPVADAEPAPAPLVLFLGDSLTAGYGLSEEQAFPARVGELLTQAGRPVRVVNAGISGDTTAGGLARLDWLLRQQPDVVVVALGANDGLRGLPLEETERNLRQIIEKSRQAGAEVILAGMLIPPNYGPDYTRGFAEIYPRLSSELSVARIPFLLEGVAAEPELNLPDGIHPTAEGQQRVAATVLPYIEEALDSRL